MLKCDELMFGDWITEKHGYPMQVTTVGKDYLYADFEDNEGDVFEFDDEDSKPYPVTLTDDFFERNNFGKKVLHYTEGSSIYEKDGNNGYNIAIRLGNPPSGPSSNVHYVHELQQLLRIAGYTEMANSVTL